MYTLRVYETEAGKNPFRAWFDDQHDPHLKAIVERRLDQVQAGHLGDHKYLQDGVSELRFFRGPGHRIYFARHGDTILLLLSAGDKSSQTKDIRRAVEYWQDFQRRTHA